VLKKNLAGAHSLYADESVHTYDPTIGSIQPGHAEYLGAFEFDLDLSMYDVPAATSLNHAFVPQVLSHSSHYLKERSYPMPGFGYAFQPIVPAPAPAAVQPNVVAPLNLPTRPPAVARRRTVEPRFQCNIDGCTKSYRRVGDCRRHTRKHQAPTLRCVVEGCHMKFDRMDKLRDHVRQGHKMNL